MPYRSPRLIEMLVDQNVCYRALGKIRSAQAACPRCGSTDIKGGTFDTGGGRNQDLLSCRKCKSRFSFTNGTFFMGAKIPLLRYIQAFVLHNALGEALEPSAACLAIGTRSPQVVSMILHRIAIVDPGIKFAVSDEELARAQRNAVSRANGLDTFQVFCETNSILVDEEQFFRSLNVAVNTPVPELVALYKLRGQRNSDPSKPIGSERPSRENRCAPDR
jgi:hypothetical protein